MVIYFKTKVPFKLQIPFHCHPLVQDGWDIEREIDSCKVYKNYQSEYYFSK